MSYPRSKRRIIWILLLAILTAGALWVWRPWQLPIVIHERINPKDGAAMVWVPAGSFRMGSSRGMGDGLRDAATRHSWREMRDVLWSRLRGKKEDSDEAPSHTVYLDGFWIYKYEVTVEQYRRFCRATGRAMPEKPLWGWQDNHPIVNVHWDEAAAYAAWAGASLPTEAQWEKAASGPDGRVYPWGNDWDETKCANSSNSGSGHNDTPWPVGCFPAGAGPYGAQDMAGNIWEWCADWYDGEYYKHAPRQNPTGPGKGIYRVIRGGSWLGGNPRDFRAADRYYYAPRIRNNNLLGFRCAVCSPGP